MEHIKNLKLLTVSLLTVFLATTISAQAADGDTPEVYSKMPIKEVTIFKDGHAFVLHEGQMPTDDKGNVILDYLPRPVMGTFWAYSADPSVKLSCVVAGRNIITLENTALNITELIKANIGKKILFRDNYNTSVQYEATIIAVPERSTEELTKTGIPGSDMLLPQQGNIILLDVAGSVKAVGLDQIRDITFLEEPNLTTSRKDFRNTMTLKLDWGNGKKTPKADVGMVYLQKGIRWIPNYKVEIDGKGKAVIKLQATIINELADVENVKAHLVIGVPSFAFKDTADPISLGQTVSQLSQYFQESAQTGYAFYNGIMSQVADGRSYRENARQPASAETVDLGPEVAGSEKNEDLFVFTVENITLKKGQRMIIPVTEYNVTYSDIYKLDLSYAPPLEARQHFDSSQQQELAKLLHAPKAKHYLRLNNKSDYPLTTAPALILRNGKIISQAMMTYTSINGICDLEMSTAIDIKVKLSEKQIKFTPNNLDLNGHSYTRIDMSGKLELTNYKKEGIKIEVKRYLLGNMDEANNDGQLEQFGFIYEGWIDELPTWWNWYSWPWWWYHVNSLGRINWELDLNPEQKIELEYSWHYFWMP